MNFDVSPNKFQINKGTCWCGEQGLGLKSGAVRLMVKDPVGVGGLYILHHMAMDP